MTAAIGLARHGIPVTVVEKFGEHAIRQNLLNLAPSTFDELARLGADDVIERISPISRIRVSDTIRGTANESLPTALLTPDPARAGSSLDGLRAVLEGGDKRTWGRIMIGDLENALRGHARTHHPDLIDVRYGLEVTGIEQGAGGVRLLTRARDGGAEEAFDGAMLISATGGRNPLGAHMRPKPSGETMYFVGGDFPGTAATETKIVRGLGDGTDLTPNRGRATTIGLHNGAPGGNSLLWAQIDRPAGDVDEALLRQVLESRARTVELPPGLLDTRPPVPVTVQLGATDRAVDGRVLLAGDDLQAPYFPNSTGANFGVITARRAADAVAEALRAGGDDAAVQRALASYESDALRASEELLGINRSTLRSALDVDPSTPELELVLP